jgi:cyclopropane-fatty-acyl-phospholipid synthase
VVARTEWLRRELASVLPDRPFTLRFWDGTRLEATRPEGPEVILRSPRAVAHALRAPGQLGLTRAYVAGDAEVDDLDRLVPLIDGYKPSRPSPAARARLLAAALRAAGPVRPPAPPRSEVRPRGRLHGRERDERAVRYHYDAPVEFFGLFLDSSMTYSCALFSAGARTLEEAQEAKLELVARKLALWPGARVLDVGCGWGGFALHAAARHGASVVGITLSESQAREARARAARAGLASRVEIRVMDYRELGCERFDAIASIGMVEHVGEYQVDEYGARLAAALEPGGRLLNQGITWLPPGRHKVARMTERFVFPDGELLHLSRIVDGLERAGFEPLHVESLRQDYAETLRHWAERLDARRQEAERLAGSERVRIWRLYLRAARNGFRLGSLSVFQVLCVRAGGSAHRERPLHANGGVPAAVGAPLAAAGGTAARH